MRDFQGVNSWRPNLIASYHGSANEFMSDKSISRK